MKIQLDIPKEINKALKIYRIQEGYDRKQDAIIDILADKFVILEYEYLNKKKKEID